MHQRTLRVISGLLIAIGWGLAAESIAVNVQERGLSVNGTSTIPLGLFGVHAFDQLNAANIERYGITATRQIHFKPGGWSSAFTKDGGLDQILADLPVFIDCQGDRYRQAEVLESPDYAERMRAWGKQYGEECAKRGHDGILEFWNEPYLNWACRSYGSSRSHYTAKWYDVSKAVDGGPVTIKGWDEPLEHFRWRRLWAAYEVEKKDKKTGVVETKQRIAWSVPVPEGLQPGDTFTDHERWYWTDRDEKTFTVVEEWNVEDPTAVSWWSGRQNLDFYLWMMVPYAEALYEANPDVTFIAGWDFDPAAAGWKVFKELYAPIVDAAPPNLAGLTEHHYGTDPRNVQAWYEVFAGYGMSSRGMWLKGYNTECGGTLDPAVHGVDGLPEAQRGKIAEDAKRAAFALHEFIGLAALMPGKVGSRTSHHAQNEPGTLAAFELVKPLRGNLLWSRSDDQRLLQVACRDGDRVTVALFNDTGTASSALVDLSAVGPTAGVLRRLEPDATGERLMVAEHVLDHPTQPTVDLGPGEAALLVLEAPAPETPPPGLARSQYFAAEGVLVPLAAGSSMSLTMDIGDQAVATATSARVRLVLEWAAPQEAEVRIGDQVIGHNDRNLLVDLPLDPALLDPTTTLTITATADGDGLQISAASIIVDHAP